jgi:uracil-DNA glycosylase
MFSGYLSMEVRIEPGWREALGMEFQKDYFTELVRHLKVERASGKTIYPPGALIFNAFELTPFHSVKVVILGQDPYHGPGQAHGLCFSVPDGVRPPPSLVNIFKEMASDTGLHPSGRSGNLTRWAQQGVLLLNASLTVRANEPNSHAGIGWMPFTDAVIRVLSERRENIVFMLWGRFAQEKAAQVDPGRHLVLRAAHPSPYSADKGFFGCRHFSRANAWLVSKGITPVDWNPESGQS